MTRWLRYIPTHRDKTREVVEITARCVRGIFLLKPSKRWNELVLGILGRAQRLTGVQIHNIDYQVNHHHMILSGDDAQQIADFMKRVQQQTSVELRIRRQWNGPAWEGPYKMTYPGRDAEDLTRRFRYVLAQGCAAGLVSSPKQWPGVCAVKALCAGKFELEGVWVDHTALGRKRRTKEGRRASEGAYSTRETVVLTKLPGWEEKSDEEYFDWVRQLVKGIEKETQDRHKAEGTRPRGPARVKRMSHNRIPKEVSWGPRLRVTATHPEERERLLSTLSAIFEAHEMARARQLAGDADPKFPEGTFPSPLPFVEVQAQRAGP